MHVSVSKLIDQHRDRWNHYWAGEVLKRPPVIAGAWKGGADVRWGRDFGTKRYWYALNRKHEIALEHYLWTLSNTEFLGEAIPSLAPDFGPDQYAAFFGTHLEYSESSPGTNWAKPIVDAWEDALPLALDPENEVWTGMRKYAEFLAASANDRFVVGMCDLHSNVDALAALRGPQKLCMDFVDVPDLIEQAMVQVRATYPTVYNGLYKASGCIHRTGSTGWTPFWSEGKFATIQADFICMVSPEMSRKYIIPALVEEAEFLDRCVYHLDGPGTIPHLDDILAIEAINVIQWVSGAGQPPMHEWLDLLKKCQKAGKGLQLYDIHDIETVKTLAKELRPEGLVYCLGMKSREETLRAIEWLEKNT